MKFLQSLTALDAARLGGSILQELGFIDPGEWLGAQSLGELILDKLFDPQDKLTLRYELQLRELINSIGYRPAVGYGTALCRTACIDVFNTMSEANSDPQTDPSPTS